MDGPPLSKDTALRVAAMFGEKTADEAAELLVVFCGNNLPFCENNTAKQMERIRYAALKSSNGRIDGLRQAIELAENDWRDLLVSAGFGEDIEAHLKWHPEPMR